MGRAAAMPILISRENRAYAKMASPDELDAQDPDPPCLFVIHSNGEGVTLTQLDRVMAGCEFKVEIPQRNHGLFQWEDKDGGTITLESRAVVLPYIFDNKPLRSYDDQQIAKSLCDDILVYPRKGYLPEEEMANVKGVVKALRRCGFHITSLYEEENNVVMELE